MTGPMYPYGPGGPTMQGNLLTVDRFLNSPTVIQRVLQNLTERNFVSQYLFRSSGANGGVIAYEEARVEDIYVDIDPNLQPHAIEPGSEFPNVGFTGDSSTFAAVQKYGGKFLVTYEQQRRDSRDVMARGLRRLANTLTRQSDERGVAAIRNHPRIARTQAAAVWDGGTAYIVKDIMGAVGRIDNTEQYKADTVIINPETAAGIIGRDEIWGRLPRENAALNPLLNPQLNGLLSLNWVTSNRQPRGEIIVCQRGDIGVVGSEIAPYTRAVDEPTLERWTVMAARIEVPVITDPQAAQVIYGVVSA